MLKDKNAVNQTQFLSGSSSVVHFTLISWQKSNVTLELPVWEGSVSWGGTASRSTLRCGCEGSAMVWQSGDDTTLPCAVRVMSILVGLGEILRSVPVEPDKTGSCCRLYRDRDWSGLRCSSLQTSWDRKEKFSHSSPMQVFKWLRSVRSFCLSQT